MTRGKFLIIIVAALILFILFWPSSNVNCDEYRRFKKDFNCTVSNGKLYCSKPDTGAGLMNQELADEVIKRCE